MKYLQCQVILDRDNENNIHEPFIQKFEELNPIIKHDRFHYKIYPDIRFTIPNGFRLSINCLIPGLSIKHIKMRKKAGITYHWIHEIDLPDNTHTRLVGTKNKYQMIHIQEIEFEIRDTEFIVCTNTGIKILRDQFPDTDILNIEFICLNKVLPELYSDRPTPNPIYGCNDPEHYYLFHVIRNSTLYNYMYI